MEGRYSGVDWYSLQCLFFSVILAKFLIEDGKSHWMSGLTLIGEYRATGRSGQILNSPHRYLHHHICDLLVLPNPFDGCTGREYVSFRLPWWRLTTTSTDLSRAMYDLRFVTSCLSPVPLCIPNAQPFAQYDI